MNTAVHFSSASSEQETPQEFFDLLNDEFGFGLDVCASELNAQCPRFFNIADNGLEQAWRGVCWMNPPYGDPEEPCKPRCTKKRCGERGWHTSVYIPGIIDWMRKAYFESKVNRRAMVVCLVPARTDTDWWHSFVALADEVRFVRGRLRFNGAPNVAPFPSAVVIFRMAGLPYDQKVVWWDWRAAQSLRAAARERVS